MSDVDKPRMPWDGIVEMVFGSKESKPAKANPWDGIDTRPKEPYKIPPLKQDKKFETVFANLIQAESRGQHTDKEGKLTTSPVGAKGITQVMKKTGVDPGYGVTPLKDDSEGEYLRFGREYLQALVKEFDGDYRKAVAAYNAGPGNIKRAIAKGKDKWEDHLPKPSETKPYMKKILGE
jgi:hypothetical protein